MIIRKIISAQKSRIGPQSMQLRSKISPMGGWGYNHFGHGYNTPITTPAKIGYTMFLLVLVGFNINWRWYWPKINEKYRKVRDALGFKEISREELPESHPRRRPFSEMFK